MAKENTHPKLCLNEMKLEETNNSNEPGTFDYCNCIRQKEN